MQWLWCWRCQAEMPMLDEEEFAEISSLYTQCILATKLFRKRWSLPLEGAPLDDLMEPLRAHYEQVTGYKETNQNAIMHHRLSLYGPPCKRCGKPLRTPQATLCGSYMFPVET